LHGWRQFAVVAVVAQHKWRVYQMDVKSTFLNGVLKEEVHVVQPLGYEIEGQEDKVYRLKKTLYGLKQALLHMVHQDRFLLVGQWFRQM